MRRERRLVPGAWWSVTVNCARSEFRLRPDGKRRHGLGFHLARALQACGGIKLVAFAQMSNHLHMVVRDDASELSNFMCRFETGLAKFVNRLDETSGQVFLRRFGSIEAIDNEAVLDQIAYVVTNPVKDRLVASVEDWPGLLVRPDRDEEMVFSRGSSITAMGEVGESYRLSVSRDVLTTDDIAWIREEIERRTALFARERNGRSVFGSWRVQRQNVFGKPRSVKRTPMPLCHAGSLEHWWSYVREWRVFQEAYRRASQAFRRGDLNVRFPEYSFRPSSSTFNVAG